MHGVICKGARVDTAIAGAGGKLETQTKGGDIQWAVGNGFTVAAHGGWRAVKNGRLSRILL